MFNMNSGYYGFSMSNNAVDAYADGEMPLSKWTKYEILRKVEKFLVENNEAPFSMDILKKAPKSVIVDLILYHSSKHHTSKYCNYTDFYAIDYNEVLELTDDIILEQIELYNERKEERKMEKENVIKYRGEIHYLRWEGTRRHPKAYDEWLCDVNIEEKGCFYIITDDEGNQLLRKKMTSNGTYVINYDAERRKREREEEKRKTMREKSSKKALEFYDSISPNCEKSLSGHIYKSGRKPDRYQYEEGVEHFFKKGEHRLYQEWGTGIIHLETWNGKNWELDD